MTDSPIPERIRLAQADLEKIEKEIYMYEDLVRRRKIDRSRIIAYIELDRRYSEALETNKDEAAPEETSPATAQIPEGKAKSAFFVDLSIEAIKQFGLPRSISALAKYIEEKGYDIGGQQPRATLAAYLSRDDRVEYNKEAGGWLVAENKEGSAEAEPSKNVGPDAGARARFSQPTPEGSIPSGSTLSSGAQSSGNSVVTQTSTPNPAVGE